MKMKLFFVLLIVFTIITSCRKESTDETSPTTDPSENTNTNINELTVPFEFDWSASYSNALDVTMLPQTNTNITTEGQLLLVIDKDNNVLSKAKIINSVAKFAIKLPVDIGDIYLMYPNSGNKLLLNKTNGSVTMAIAPEPRDGTKNGLVYDKKFAFKYQQKLSKFAHNKSINGVNLVLNGEFDIDNLEKDNRYWTNLRVPGKWYYTKNSEGHVSNVDGENVFKNYSSSYEIIEQSFPVLGGSAFDFSMTFSGSINLWLDNFDVNGNWIGETHVTTSGNTITSSGVILANATHFQFYVGINTGAHVDKIVYESVDVVLDTDGDGVNDNGDDYPTNPAKAYKIMYPNVGYETISFEDLWPYKGDYDFNDLVMLTKGELSVNADGYYVDAVLNTKINAGGGSIPMGFACNILDANKTAITTSIVTNVTGDGHMDNNVVNGIIIFDNKFDVMIPYYTNTSYNKTGTPIRLTTNLTFNNNYVGALVPNYYIYQTENRGCEIHMPNFPPTEAADQSLLGTGNDNAGTPYRTVDGLPWAISVVSTDSVYKHPLEGIEVTEAYTKFSTWATSSGENEKTWYKTPINDNVYTKQ